MSELGVSELLARVTAVLVALAAFVPTVICFDGVTFGAVVYAVCAGILSYILITAIGRMER